MKSELEKNKFFVIKNFISSETAKKLSKEFENYCDQNPLVSDDITPNTPSHYNYISFLELLCEKTTEVSDIIKEKVFPTFCYARVYKNGDILPKHLDRDACEISLTLHLDGDADWNFYVEDNEGKEVSISLKSGDAIIYLGCDVLHWRNPYEGQKYTQVFLHYVRSRGSKNYAFFDNVDLNFFKTNDKKRHHYKEIKNTRKVQEEIDVGDIEKYIIKYDDVLSPELCNKIIEEYKNSFNIDHYREKNIKNLSKILISSPINWKINYHTKKNIDCKIYDSLNNIIRSYSSTFPDVEVSKDSGYELVKYNVGQYCSEHVDSSVDSNRVLSVYLCLSDNYGGGEYAFFGKKRKFKLDQGSALIFPSNFLFPHETLPVSSGTKYSLVSWFVS